MKQLLRLFPLLLLICVFAGCKPSEKNYRAAYDVAVAKRQKDAPDPYAGLGDAVRDDAPARREVDGKILWVRTEPLTCADDRGSVAPWNVAVAAYKMAANARSHAERLKSEGYGSLLLKNSDGMIYVVAATPGSLQEAAEFIEKFKVKHPEAIYVGLPEGPTVLSSGRRR